MTTVRGQVMNSQVFQPFHSNYQYLQLAHQSVQTETLFQEDEEGEHLVLMFYRATALLHNDESGTYLPLVAKKKSFNIN